MTSAAPLPTAGSWADRMLAIGDASAFDALAMEAFRLHAAGNPVYRAFLDSLGIAPGSVADAARIPCLPITLFRTHRIVLDGLTPSAAFTSSGTTGAATSTHHVAWPALYEASFTASFAATYGAPGEWRILALLPSYLERTGSSLVHMAEKLISLSGDALSGFYLHDLERLAATLRRSESEGKRTLLLGVTFALLDLAERFPMPLRHTIIMETGGMKGRRPEIVREELHAILKRAFHVRAIHSEYGMTELLSQAWSTGDGVYRCPPWMQVRMREVNDPFASVPVGRTGGIDVIDLANVASCPFISTQDLGRMHADGSFEVLGRFDNSDARGCNLMVE
jgi:phenylacetate-coenzyme A ligase PaaK-like adenylate-forming protein